MFHIYDLDKEEVEDFSVDELYRVVQELVVIYKLYVEK